MSKIDKGFEPIYWKLSYRRKFIRTLWVLPFILMIPILYSYTFEILIIENIIITGLLMLGWGIQLVYNYKKYQNENLENN